LAMAAGSTAVMGDYGRDAKCVPPHSEGKAMLAIIDPGEPLTLPTIYWKPS
jgi:hypothetical protein